MSRTRRLIKAPKVFWSDTGLAMHLSGEASARGTHLENLVLTDLLAWAESKPRKPGVLYWRTAGGAEVDYDGEEVFWLDRRILAAPWHRVV